MSVVAISSVPTDAHGETNKVFLNPEDMATIPDAKLINIGGIVFTLASEPRVEKGHLAMNLLQRRSAGVSTNAHDRVDLRTNTSKSELPAPKEIGTVMFEVGYTSSSKKGGDLDYAEVVEYITDRFAGQYFTTNQEVLLILPGSKYVATVKEINVASASAGLEGTPCACLGPQSKIFIEGAERCQMNLRNIPASQADALQPKLVGNFDLEKLGIGGLRNEFGQVFRRAFASRIFPQSIVKKLGIKHVKGVLLYGPPGTGKTLIARKIGEILNCRKPEIVNGPEIFNKFVGGTEENVRKLFAPAEAEQAQKGEQSQLHLIIFDEFDAICKQRGAVRDGTGVSDNVVNQLLSKIDGVNTLNNVLLIGMTNRKDLIDEAILRPGRFEVHVEIGLPDEGGRLEILKIHTAGMRADDILDKSVDLAALAKRTKNFSGAELEGIVRNAQSHAFSRHIDFENPTETTDVEHIRITNEDFDKALGEYKPAFGQARDECESVLRNGIIGWGDGWDDIKHKMLLFISKLSQSSTLSSLSVLLSGAVGTGKSAIAGHIALESEFPYAKFLSCDTLVGYGEMNKCNIFRKAFEDAYKSKLSVIVLDDIERLVEYSHLGGRYSNVLLQTLLVLIKRPPPEGRKLLVIGTCTNRDILSALELDDCFAAHVDLPLLPPSALAPVCDAMKMRWPTAHQCQEAMEALPRVSIKKLIFLLEMAAVGGTNEQREITYDGFVKAMRSSGIEPE